MWNRAAEKSGKRRRVFCASLADVFDNEWPAGVREHLWALIVQTPMLDWLLLTKRIGNVRLMVPEGWLQDGFPYNVRLMITVVNQEEAERDVPKLLALNCKNGISYEPALSAVDWRKWLLSFESNQAKGWLPKVVWNPRLQWVIVGGESAQGGHAARPFNVQWARLTVRQCNAAGVPVFVKQLGSFVIDRNDDGFEGDGDDLWPNGTADKLEWNPLGII